jgi:nucleoside-diphosphate-sugar epimerase
MKIIVVGATGTIGAEVVKALSARQHDVISASRKGAVKVAIEDGASISAMFDQIPGVDAVVCCAGNAHCIKYWHGYVVGVKDLEEDQWKAGRNAGYPGLPRNPP